MLRRLYDWVLKLAEHPRAAWALAAVSFAESSFFPIPPDVMLIPMCLARRERAWVYAGLCTVASVLGGLLGYAIGALLYDTLGRYIIELYGYRETAEQFRAGYAAWGHWIILLKGLTPIPFKIITITSGFAGYDLFWFVVLSIITRGGRFYLVAALIYVWGPHARDFIEKRLEWFALLFAVLFIGGFVAAVWLF
jgi:membrane protein YqaA with SNARE-associated domain